MTTTRYVKTAILTSDDGKNCDSRCPQRSLMGDHCLLFDRPLPFAKAAGTRLKVCIEAEVKP